MHNVSIVSIVTINTAAVFIAWYACSETLAVEFHAFGVAAVADSRSRGCVGTTTGSDPAADRAPARDGLGTGR